MHVGSIANNSTENLNVDHAKYFIPRLESARGVASTLVVLHHCFGNFVVMRGDLSIFQQSGIWGYATRMLAAMLNGHGAVIFFFVLSGYVISISLAGNREIHELRPYIGYLTRRIFRLYPAHVAVILAWFLLVMLLQNAAPAPNYSHLGLAPNYLYVYSNLISGQNWPSGIELVRNIILTSWTINPVTWSLSVEMFANIFLPILVTAAGFASNLQRILLALGLLWLMAAEMYSNYYLTYLIAFYAGALIRPCGEQILSLIEEKLSAPFIIVICVFLFTVPMLCTENRPFLVLVCEVLSSWIIVTMLSIRPLTPAFKFLDVWAVRFVGRVSYSLYLCHFLVIIALLRIVHQFFDGVPGRLEQATLVIPFCAACLIISMIFSWFLYYLIEMPFSKIGKTFSRYIYHE